MTNRNETPDTVTDVNSPLDGFGNLSDADRATVLENSSIRIISKNIDKAIKVDNETDAESPWIRVDPPYFWAKHSLTVVGDRYDSAGRRQHVVRGSVPVGTVIANADIFGEDHPSWAATCGSSSLI